MNRQNRQHSRGASVFYAQMIITVFMLALFLMLPMYSQTAYDQTRAFLTDALQQNTGIDQVNALQSAISAIEQVTQPTEEVVPESVSAMQIPVNCTFEPCVLTVSVLPPVRSDNVTSAFGWRVHPITGKDDFHTGVDIAAPKGTDITAPIDGTVTSVKQNDEIYGKCLQITDGNASVFLAHCENIEVKEGQKVKAGDVVGHVGTTGMSTGYHLHFELMINSVRVDPLTCVNL